MKDKREYTPVYCVESGNGFIEGHIYASMGFNNGVHVLREDDLGNVSDQIVHNYDEWLCNPEDYEHGRPKFMEVTEWMRKIL
jgi:hypothetical protein